MRSDRGRELNQGRDQFETAGKPNASKEAVVDQLYGRPVILVVLAGAIVSGCIHDQGFQCLAEAMLGSVKKGHGPEEVSGLIHTDVRLELEGRVSKVTADEA